MSETILITGANRGLGFEFTRQYAKEGNKVIACCRHLDEAKELEALQEKFSNIDIHELDITSEKAIKVLQKEITQPIDLLINNAGYLESENHLGQISTESMMKNFMINAMGAFKVTEAFIDQLSKSKRKLAVAISSSMGSISENTSGGYYSYRASKAALNMLMKSLGIDLMPYGIRVLLLHPGWVKTRMGGDEAQHEPSTSVAGMRKVIANYSPKEGEVKFIRFNGEEISW